MISSCRKCGKLVEMTTEEAYTPEWCCRWSDRLCQQCYQEAAAKQHKAEQKWMEENIV